MDVLRLIKEDHDQLRSMVKQLSETTAIAAKRKILDEVMKNLSKHLYIESEFLFPEVSDLFVGADGFIKASTGTQKAIKKVLAEIQDISTKKPGGSKGSLDEKISKFTELVERHLLEEESLLMPKMRELIPTQDREDLGQVYLDMQEGFLALLASRGARRLN